MYRLKTGSLLKFALIAALAVGIVLFPLPAAKTVPAVKIVPAERVFRIQASRFAYEPGIIRVNPGERVTIELEALDVVHGLAIDGYGIETTADPGQTARVSFVAERSGSFRFRCNVTCGNMHPFMIGKIQIGSNDLLMRALGLAVLAILAGVVRGWK